LFDKAVHKTRGHPVFTFDKKTNALSTFIAFKNVNELKIITRKKFW
jgi:hypothetical protein